MPLSLSVAVLSAALPSVSVLCFYICLYLSSVNVPTRGDIHIPVCVTDLHAVNNDSLLCANSCCVPTDCVCTHTTLVEILIQITRERNFIQRTGSREQQDKKSKIHTT
jgi:hypothetical protein